MDWAWAGSIEHLWRLPNLAVWLVLAAAMLFAVVLLVVVLRADKSVANAALAVIALLAIGIAVAAGTNGSAPKAAGNRELGQVERVDLGMPALACLDDLAGEVVLAACEKQLFGSPDAVAAAVSATAARLARLTAAGDVATADRAMTSDLAQLRRAVERDRYGLVAHVLASRDRCQPGQCAAFRSLTDHNQISANMDERVYESMIGRHAASWTAASPDSAPIAPGLAGLPPVAPTGRPTNAEFPTSASIPPVNIMTPEPTTSAASPRSPNPPVAAAPRTPNPPAAANAQLPPRPAQAPAAAKKPAAPPKRPAAPVQLAPAAAGEDN